MNSYFEKIIQDSWHILKGEQMLKSMKSNHFHIVQPKTGPEDPEALGSTAI